MRSIIPKGLLNAIDPLSCCKGNTASVFPYPAALLTPIKSFKAKIPAPEQDEDFNCKTVSLSFALRCEDAEQHEQVVHYDFSVAVKVTHAAINGVLATAVFHCGVRIVVRRIGVGATGHRLLA